MKKIQNQRGLLVSAVGISDAFGIKTMIENSTIEPDMDIQENKLRIVIRLVPKVQFFLHLQR